VAFTRALLAKTAAFYHRAEALNLVVIAWLLKSIRNLFDADNQRFRTKSQLSSISTIFQQMVHGVDG
jgi:hypothetical protein